MDVVANHLGSTILLAIAISSTARTITDIIVVLLSTLGQVLVLYQHTMSILWAH
jgi:hypothetical protein